MPGKKKDYQKFFKKMAVPRFIVNVRDADEFYISEANDLALQYFNQSLRDVQDKKIQDCLDHENAQHFQQCFEVCVSKKRSVTIQSLPGMPGHIRIHGFYITPVLTEKEELDYLDVIGHMDVADQSILQRERDDAVSLLTSIFDVSEVGVVVTDQDRRIVRVNESFVRTFGWKRSELMNEDIAEFVTPDERPQIQKDYDDFILTGERSSGEMKIIRKEGSVANALYTTATLDLSQGRRFQITTVMDITLRKQMEQSLRVAKDQADSSNRSKSVFLANMSHELRTPLNAIIGFSEMMIEETFGALGHEKYKEYLGDVHSSARHLLEIINEVLDMSKIEAGRIELDEEEIDIDETIKSVVRMLDSRAFGKNVTLNVQCNEKLPHLYADRRLTRQVFINLLSNAVKFSESGTNVDIQAAMEEDGSMQVIVVDHGMGIPEDKIQRAMEPFGQVSDKAEDSKYQGTGLGLPLAKAMVDLHGGTLRLESEVGVGTTIYINFPKERVLKKKSKAKLADRA